MLTAILAALAIIAIYMAFRYYRVKNDDKYKDSLTEAYKNKDYDTYLAILNYRIAHTSEIKDKNILATIKINAYLCQRDWEKVEALYKQVSIKKLPKKIKLTFLCNYITGLYLMGNFQKAQAFVKTNSNFLKQGEEVSLYKVYYRTFEGFDLYYAGDYPGALEVFQELKDSKITNDFFNSVFDEYIEKSKNQ